MARVIRWPDGAPSDATRDDVARLARLCDALPMVHCVVPMVEPQDVPGQRAEVIAFLDTLVRAETRAPSPISLRGADSARLTT